jgi:hypothetical protein
MFHEYFKCIWALHYFHHHGIFLILLCMHGPTRRQSMSYAKVHCSYFPYSLFVSSGKEEFISVVQAVESYQS